MAALVIIGGIILGYAIYKQNQDLGTTKEIVKAYEKGDELMIGSYNPYVLNNYVPWSDRIFSADIEENKIYTKPDKIEYGLYGMTEHHIKLNPVDVNTVVSRKDNLNI